MVTQNRCIADLSRLAFLIVCGSSALALPQTADTLKARFANLLGPNRYARCVWQVEGQKNRKTNFDAGGSSTIMAFDSKTGIKRVLARPNGGHYSSPSLTWDGKRVVFTDNVKFQIVVVDFADSSTRRVLLNNFEGDGRTYRTADGKDWIYATEYPGSDDVNGARLYRVNLDNPNEKYLVWTCTGGSTNCGWRVGYAGATCWAMPSGNGRYVSGGFPNWGKLGIIDTVTKKLTYFQNEVGCWPSIARDTTGDILTTPGGDATDSHRAAKIMTRTEVQLARPNFYTGGAMAGKPGANTNVWWDALRWTMDRDFCTYFIFYNVNGGAAWNVDNYPGPRLVQISTMKWVALNDNPTYPEGNMDVYFYNCPSSELCSGSVASLPLHRVGSLRAGATALTGRMFDLRGRSITRIGWATDGVFLRTIVRPGSLPNTAVVLGAGK